MKKHYFPLKRNSLYLILMGLCLSLSSFAQNITVTGVVKDSHFGEPVIGASILEKGTMNGIVTDFNGNFTLQVAPDAEIVVSYIGYISQTVAVNGQTSLNVILHEDVEALDEVIVVGYATGSKRTVSGAVERIKREDMNQGVVTNPLESIKGKVAGVVISQNGGDPTGAATIRVRGTTSLSGGNDPLVIIDGVFGDMNMLNAISPADIESFTILKDASETAQYGSRGASGVIVVSTIKGKSGVKTISYDGTFGISTVYKNVEMLSADEFRAASSNPMDLGYNSNFIDAIQRTGYVQNHRVSFGGGMEDANYRASIGVIDQQGVIKNNDMRNYTAKLDMFQSMFDSKLKLEFGMFGSMRQMNQINDAQKTFQSAASFNPTFPLGRNAAGEWDDNPYAVDVEHPMGRLEIKDYQQNAYANVHGKITWKIIDGLNLSAFGSYTYNAKEERLFIPMDIKSGRNEGGGKAERKDKKQDILMGNLQLTYTKNFGKHRIDALGLMEGQKYHNTGFASTARGFQTNYFEYNNLEAGGTVRYGDVTSYENENRLVSFMGRLNYVYNERYIATVNLRTDASSKLGDNNKWGFFPSASLAWVLSEEGAIKDLNWISNLKVRAGYGLTGNQDAIEAYNSLALLGPTGFTVVKGQPTATYGFKRNSNPDLRWEVKRTFDVGVDASFLDSRLSVTADYYLSRTKDLLYKYDVPVPPFIYPELLANLGEMENNGFELAVSGSPIKTKDFELNMGVNLSFQKNKLLSLSGTYMGQELNAKEYMDLAHMTGAGITSNNQVVYQMVGHPVGVFYLAKANGIDSEGKYIVEDLDGNGEIDLNPGGDRYIAGQVMPKTYLGASLNIRYKQFDLSTQWNGAFGHKIYNGTSMFYSNLTNLPTYNVMKGAPEKGIYDSTITDYWLESGNYVNIDYITLGWNVKAPKLDKIVKNLRVTFSVNNVATISSYSGVSPMINSTKIVLDSTDKDYNTLGMDNKRFYPLARTYSLGLSVNF